MLGGVEFHHPGYPQPIAQWRARHALSREVDRPGRQALDRDAEAVAAAGLHGRPHPEAASEPPEPGTGGEDHRVERQRLAAGDLHDGLAAVVADVANLQAFPQVTAPGA